MTLFRTQGSEQWYSFLNTLFSCLCGRNWSPQGKTHHIANLQTCMLPRASKSQELLNLSQRESWQSGDVSSCIEQISQETRSPSFFFWNGEILHSLLDSSFGDELAWRKVSLTLRSNLGESSSKNCSLVKLIEPGQVPNRELVTFQ